MNFGTFPLLKLEASHFESIGLFKCKFSGSTSNYFVFTISRFISLNLLKGATDSSKIYKYSVF